MWAFSHGDGPLAGRLRGRDYAGNATVSSAMDKENAMRLSLKSMPEASYC
jgi:hypothetical protein